MTKASAETRLDDALARIRAPELEGAKVFTALYEASAREEAKASDARREAGTLLGPLDGRIVSIKDLLDVAGETTRAGSAILHGQEAAAEDAPVIKRLRAAGAVIVGKTQMTEFAFSALGTNPHDPVAGNPRDRSRCPGGSSSGAVVSVLDGMAEIAIGSDTGGSIRIPAALCGAVGFKPSGGRIPLSGAFSLSSSLDTLGPIATSVADCAATDAVLAGLPAEPFSPKPPKRIVVARGRMFDGVAPEILEAFETGLDRLRAAGIAVEDGSIEPILDRIGDIDRIGGFPAIELGATLIGLGVSTLDGVDPKTKTRIETGAATLAIDYVRMQRLRAAAIAAFEAFLSEDEAVIAPTTRIVAPTLESVASDEGFHQANSRVLRHPRVGNLLDCPSISLPAPVAKGRLPVGMMLMGRRGADRRFLALAASVEAALA